MKLSKSNLEKKTVTAVVVVILTLVKTGLCCIPDEADVTGALVDRVCDCGSVCIGGRKPRILDVGAILGYAHACSTYSEQATHSKSRMDFFFNLIPDFLE